MICFTLFLVSEFPMSAKEVHKNVYKYSFRHNLLILWWYNLKIELKMDKGRFFLSFFFFFQLVNSGFYCPKYKPQTWILGSFCKGEYLALNWTEWWNWDNTYEHLEKCIIKIKIQKDIYLTVVTLKLE